MYDDVYYVTHLIGGWCFAYMRARALEEAHACVLLHECGLLHKLHRLFFLLPALVDNYFRLVVPKAIVHSPLSSHLSEGNSHSCIIL